MGNNLIIFYIGYYDWSINSSINVHFINLSCNNINHRLIPNKIPLDFHPRVNPIKPFSCMNCGSIILRTLFHKETILVLISTVFFHTLGNFLHLNFKYLFLFPIVKHGWQYIERYIAFFFWYFRDLNNEPWMQNWN